MISLMLPLILSASPGGGAPDYATEIKEWRSEVERRLKRDEGWLTVAGLFWLKPGANSIGSDPQSDIVLPARAAAKVGTLTLADGKVTLDAIDAQIGGKPVTHTAVRSDAEREMDRVHTGGLVFTIIQRGARTGVRLYDPNADTRVHFSGLKWYPANPKMVIRAKFVPYTPAHTISITNVLGDVSPAECPGYAEFKIEGQTVRLEAQSEGEALFFNFKDATSGKTTYPAGRFLNSGLPKDGWVTLDFNRATNPPCAFTAFATCPLPPASNRLKVAIPAGEMKYH